ncbi:hypothetical protein TrCOL_g742 [Triparma columacea]|uniref:Ribosomal protein S9 n=1 Tax=Triparma columacea TaxID=722753 RepID=A0A9W7L6G4_9STRA|nr:hypothetical protein TrCOL_g742 [Triparma columacea]
MLHSIHRTTSHLTIRRTSIITSRPLSTVVESSSTNQSSSSHSSSESTQESLDSMDIKGRIYSTGRRKTSAARVWITPKDFSIRTPIIINKQPLHEWCTRGSDREELLRPFVATSTLGMYQVWATVKGGGTTGQVGAIRHGLSRALEKHKPELRKELKPEGLLTRDPRMVERKKPGRAKARKSFQWVKR